MNKKKPFFLKLFSLSILLVLPLVAFPVKAGDIQSILNQDMLWQIPANAVNYYFPSDRSPQTSEARAQVPIPIENATTSLRNFYLYVENINSTGTISAVVKKNGSPTDIQVIFEVGETGWKSDTENIVEFQKDDLFSIEIKNTGNSYCYVLHWIAEIFTQSDGGNMLPEYIEQINSTTSTSTSFYLDKTITYGDSIIFTLLFVIIVFSVAKFLLNWFIPKKLNWKQH